MNEDKSSISQAQSYQEIGEFWDNHDLGDSWEDTQPVEFEVDLRSSTTYYPIETGLATKLRLAAEQRGVSVETLVNLWLQEKMLTEASTT